jgi:hypothetical protein
MGNDTKMDDIGKLKTWLKKTPKNWTNQIKDSQTCKYSHQHGQF